MSAPDDQARPETETRPQPPAEQTPPAGPGGEPGDAAPAAAPSGAAPHAPEEEEARVAAAEQPAQAKAASILEKATGAAAPAAEEEDEAGGARAALLSTVLGPLPAAVPAQQTRDLNDAVHRILVIGLAASTVLLVVGLALDLMAGRALPTEVLPFDVAVQRALALRPSGFLSLGLLVLMFTPVVRVLGSIIVFLWERDWFYVGVTVVVLIVMLTSVLVGHG